MFCIIANVKSDKALRTGAKVYLLNANQGADHVEVHGISKSGRRINKYLPYKRLENFRAAWVPDHLNSKKTREWWAVGCWWYEKADAKDAADKLTAAWDGVRYFSAGGSCLMQDGVTTSVAYQRALDMGGHDLSYLNHIDGRYRRIHKCIPMDFMVAGHHAHIRFQLKK